MASAHRPGHCRARARHTVGLYPPLHFRPSRRAPKGVEGRHAAKAMHSDPAEYELCVAAGRLIVLMKNSGRGVS